MNVQHRLKPLPTSRNGLYLHLVSNLKWHNSQVSCLRTRNHVSMQCLCTKPRVPLQWQGLSRSSPNSWTDRLDDWQIRQLGEERPTPLKLRRSVDKGCVKITKSAICCLIKNKVITTVDQKKGKYLKKSKIKVKPTKLFKLTRENVGDQFVFVLVLHLIGWETGASFLDCSQGEVKQKQCNLGLLSTLNWKSLELLFSYKQHSKSYVCWYETETCPEFYCWAFFCFRDRIVIVGLMICKTTVV